MLVSLWDNLRPPSKAKSALFLLNVYSVEPVKADSVFLQPQELSVQLRPGVGQSFFITITRPSGQPIRELTMDTSPLPVGVNITFNYISNPAVVEVSQKITQT